MIVALCVAASLLVACGGDGGEQASPTTPSTASQPDQSAGDFMKELLQQGIRGQYGRSWESLHPAHQEVVSREKYDTCERASADSLGATKIDLAVVDTYEEPVRVEGDGMVESTAVTLRFTYNNPFTGKPAEEHATAHAVAVNGEWKWILTPKDYNAYVKGNCPPSD